MLGQTCLNYLGKVPRGPDLHAIVDVLYFCLLGSVFINGSWLQVPYHFLIEISWALILQKHPGSLNQQNEKLNTKPPLPNNTASQFRKGAYHESLDFVMSLCETSYGLVDVFPVEDRKSALCEVNAFLSFLFLTYRYYTHVWDCFPVHSLGRLASCLLFLDEEMHLFVSCLALKMRSKQ